MKPMDKWPWKYKHVQGEDGGMFFISFKGNRFAVIASNQGGWDHVSVSLKNRCPTWKEMCHIKDLFWNDDEVVVQYHPAKKEYVNNHPYCLHMWKPQWDDAIPTPPMIMVGI